MVFKGGPLILSAKARPYPSRLIAGEDETLPTLSSRAAPTPGREARQVGTGHGISTGTASVQYNASDPDLAEGDPAGPWRAQDLGRTLRLWPSRPILPGAFP